MGNWGADAAVLPLLLVHIKVCSTYLDIPGFTPSTEPSRPCQNWDEKQVQAGFPSATCLVLSNRPPLFTSKLQSLERIVSGSELGVGLQARPCIRDPSFWAPNSSSGATIPSFILITLGLISHRSSIYIPLLSWTVCTTLGRNGVSPVGFLYPSI
jgi:hypothetical protein